MQHPPPFFREKPFRKIYFLFISSRNWFFHFFLRESSRHYQVLASALRASPVVCARFLRLHFQFDKRKIRRDYNFKLNEGASLAKDVIATCYPCLRSLERDSVPFDVFVETDLHELRTESDFSISKALQSRFARENCRRCNFPRFRASSLSPNAK